MKFRGIKYFLIFLFLQSNLIFAQTITESKISKMGPHILQLFEISPTNLESAKGDKIFRMTYSSPESEELIGVTIGTNEPNRLKSMGINVNAIFSEFVTARILPSQIPQIAELEEVRFISIGNKLYPHNDLAKGLSGIDLIHNGYINNTSYKGSGVIVCIIDTGIDWSHLDFRDPGDPTQSRILFIWDQTLEKTGSEETPADAHAGTDFDGFTYGVEYSQADIEDEIDGSAANFVREEDTDGHGTHVAGTAAGNGASLSTGKFGGMAPEADIIVVKAGNGSFSDTNVKNGLAWAKAIADEAGKPLAINMSLGGISGAHDGTSSQELAVDDVAGTGKVVVISAGNDGTLNSHITGTIANGDSVTFQIAVSSFTPNTGVGDDYFTFDLWHDTSADVTVRVNSPNGAFNQKAVSSQGTSQTVDGEIYIFNYVNGDYTNGDQNNYFRVRDYDSDPGVGVTNVDVATGTWNITVKNNSGGTRTYHGWLASSTMTTTLTNGDNEYMVGSPGNASEAITVGSYVSRWRWANYTGSMYNYNGTNYSDDISSFSSIGPRRDNIQKPDIAGPGQGIISSTSSSYTPAASNIIAGEKHHLSQGTSMSSPVVAGFVALLLEQSSSRTAAQCKSLITDNADTDSYTGSVPNTTWGYGKLNAFNAMAKAVNSGFTVDKSMYITDTWAALSYTTLDLNEKFAVKFTPASNGDVTGLFFHTYATINFTGNLSIEIWSNDVTGIPSTKLGSTATISVDNILANSWNYITITDCNVSVISGTDYHAVIYFSSGTALDILLDANSGGSSSVYNSSWSSIISGADFHMRPVVSTASAALPVELTNFTGQLFDGKVLLNWATATEVDNFGFNVERRKVFDNDSESTEWENIAFVEGHGNSNSPKTYSYIDENPLGANKFEYRLVQIDFDGTFDYSDTVTVILIQLSNELFQNYPNPFNPKTKIKFSVNQEGRVSLNIFNILGQKVIELVNENLEAGFHEVEFDGRNLPSGVYIYRLKVNNNYNEIRKMLLLK